MKKRNEFYVTFFTNRPERPFAELLPSGFPVQRKLRDSRAFLPARSVNPRSAIAYGVRFWGRRTPKIAGTLPKILRRGIFGSVPLRVVPYACFAKGRGFDELYRLTAGPQSKESSRFAELIDFVGIEPPKSLGENSCFPLKPFSACYRVLHGFAVSRRFAPVAPAGLRTFF